MRFTILAAAALLSAAPVLAAPDADTLIAGYERLFPLTQQWKDDIDQLSLTNSPIIVPRMVTVLTRAAAEAEMQADVVRDGAEPLADEDQQRTCDAFDKFARASGENLAAFAKKTERLSTLQGSQALAPLGPVFSRFPKPYETMTKGFMEAAPNCAQQTLDNLPDVSGLLDQVIAQFTGGR